MIVPIVEGHGEMKSMGVIIRRAMSDSGLYMQVGASIRVKRYQVVKPGELEKAIDLAFAKRTGVRALLLILDADDDCPKNCGALLRERGSVHVGNRGYFGVVLANRELEAWFLADIEGLSEGIDGAPFEEVPDEVEGVRDAKGLLSRALGCRYTSTLDQPRFAARFNLRRASDRCRSFRKFQTELQNAGQNREG